MQEEKTQEIREIDAEMLSKQAAPVQPVGYGATEADDPAELVPEQEVVRAVMAKLPEPLRLCLLLSVIGGLSTAEIATMLEMKEAAVRQRLVRARKQFQQLYTYESGEEIYDPSASAIRHGGSDTASTSKDAAEDQSLSNHPQWLTLSAHPATTRRSYA